MHQLGIAAADPVHRARRTALPLLLVITFAGALVPPRDPDLPAAQLAPPAQSWG